MNKIIGGILALLGAVAMTSCGQSAQQQDVTSSGEAQSKSMPVVASSGSPHVIDPSVIASAKPTGQPCSLDSIDDSYAKQVVVAAGKPHVFRGWLLNASRQPAGKFSLILEGTQAFAIAAHTGASRPDVGTYLGEPKLSGAGFEFESSLAKIPVGNYKLMLLINDGGRVYSCEIGKELQVG